MVEVLNNAYTWIDISSVSGHRTIISCVISPLSSGYLEHPNGIQLVPSGDDCEVEDPGEVKEVVQPGLWRDVLGLIAEMAPRDDDGIQTQGLLDDHIRSTRSSNRWQFVRETADSGHTNHPTVSEGHATEKCEYTWTTGNVDGWVNRSLLLISSKHNHNCVWSCVVEEPSKATSTASDCTTWCTGTVPSPVPDDRLSDVDPRNPNTSRFSPA